ncbi:hypothetical protein [Myceligenerans indicum]|uniref:Uncharacterized protein n=1 Tax=Myceligenerans indicum TaxID=2593663 RepID=A0ABS1LQR0_9MICO|nr:hypothetical protein [Myceligenerans indicum]MBL0888621.1 hypothetical protein [Myceligenerans indicum]
MSDPTVRFTPGMNPRPVRSGEPMTMLVFDQELVGRLQALQQSGFGIRAEQVIAEHLVKVGQHRAGGRTPREIKEYIWQQMQWGDTGATATTNGDLHSLRRSVRANTEVANPPENFLPQPPGAHGIPGDAAAQGVPGSADPRTAGEHPAQEQQAQEQQAQEHGSGTRPAGAAEATRAPAGAFLAWIPRILLGVSLYQLVRVFVEPGHLPDVSRWEPFRVLGDRALELLRLNPDWSGQAAELTIPVLGLVLAVLLNLFTPSRRGRKLRVWPYVLVIGTWIVLLAVSGVLSFASDTTETVRQGVREQVDQTIEDRKQQLRDALENAVDDQADRGTRDLDGA